MHSDIVGIPFPLKRRPIERPAGGIIAEVEMGPELASG
jgi:hypothetical protein